ncbi:MAG: ABC transporter substrate-binding protein [Gammaproteobacteria bacterium]|nr:ABC transporter substrate-binding protein [Gammaproteobacteria bacterium]
MKKLNATVFAAALFAAALAAHADKWTEIRIGVEGAYPPFSSITDSGQLVGFDIDIALELCKTIGAECSLVPQDWDGIIPALLARKYDAIIASMSITEERKKRVAFSDKYYNTPARFVRRKGSGVEISKAGLGGKTVGVQRATTHDNFITDEFGDTVTVKRYGTQDEAYLDLVAGRVDLLIADSIAIDDGFLSTDQGADFEFVGPSYSDPRYFGEGAGVAIRKQDTDLVELFNRAIRTIRANGRYQAINDKYFDFDIYGD